MRFISILTIFLAYTSFKAIQLMPNHLYWMLLLSLVFFILMIGPTLISRVYPAIAEKNWFAIFTWIGSSFIGFWGTYIMISIPIDIFHLLFSFFGKNFLTQNAYLIIFGCALLMSALGFIEVLRGPKIVEVDVAISKLPKALQDLKIAQISDLHIGPTIQTRYVKKVVEKTNATNPDIIVITGDLVDSHTETIKKHLLPLKNLKSKYGIYYVTGNHEYYWGIESLIPELKNVGLTVLLNTNHKLDINGASVLVAGLTDPAGSHFSKQHIPNLREASEAPKEADLKILLAHRPDPYKEAQKAGYHLQFSGHTHAGQFFPFSLLIPFAHKYYRGLNRYENLWLYVNPGTGYWGPANRFAIAAEITLVKLSGT